MEAKLLKGPTMPAWSKIAIPLVAVAVAGIAYFYFSQPSPCESDPRSRECFEFMLETHLAR
jgi:hypothetical protein